MARQVQGNPANVVDIPEDAYNAKIGKVRIWDIARGKYVWLNSMEAKEYIHLQAGLFYRPGDEPAGEGGALPKAVANALPTTPPARSPSSIAAARRGDQPQGSSRYEFNAHTVEELKIFLADAGIDIPAGMRKDELVALLEKARYVPPSA